ncbi:MAG TPA: ATP-binding protein [Nitrospiria bacterium]|jgi:PAS domain S-box-containing protein|nr:ATP-binding protein [Nitrospiria bacterium]
MVRSFFTLLVVLLLIFFGLLNLHYTTLLDADRVLLVNEVAKHLVVLSEQVAEELRGHQQQVLADPYYLYAIGTKRGIDRMVLLDQSARILSDSAGLSKPGTVSPALGIRPAELAKVWAGGSVISPIYTDESKRQVKTMYLPLTDSGSQIVAVLGVSLDVSEGDKAEQGAVTALLIKLFVTVAALVISYYLIKLFLVQRGIVQASGLMPGRGQMEKTGFVIDTFHDLIQQLKAKEQELERLRSSAETRAARIEHYNENILQSVASGVITFNQKYVITTFNQAAERILDFFREEAVGKSCEELFGKESEITQFLEASIDRQQPITRQECGLRKKNGERIWVGVSTTLLRDPQNQVIGTTLVFSDLTEIKRLQEQVELKKRLMVLGEMSAGLAHEIRNFMGTIMGFSRLLSKKLEAGDPKQRMVEAILAELNAMDRLIDDLLRYARTTELNIFPLELEPLVRNVALRALNQAREPKPKLTISIAPDLPRVKLDEIQIRQALTNLIQNAIEAMPQGGELRVTVSVRSMAQASTIKEIEISISDTGAGIPKDRMDRIFLPFFTMKEKGTGLGLAIVHKIVLSHNGRIEVDSQEGMGTTFRLYFSSAA